MLLNKIPVLDKGFVSEFDAACNSQKLDKLAQEYFGQLKDDTLKEKVGSLTLLIKCPLFLQLNLSLFGLTIASIPQPSVDVYLPGVGEIGAPTLEATNAIASDIKRTSEALLINPLAYQQDGCDRFTSQVLTPINTYTTILVHGMYNNWCRFTSQNNAPNCILAYMNAVEQILKAEWQ